MRAMSDRPDASHRPEASGAATTYLGPDRAALAAFVARATSGPITMLNLLRFRATADYVAAGAPQLAPPASDPPLGGAAAYARYMNAAAPLIAAVGGELVLTGTASAFLIGPAHESWDAVLVARYPGKEAFLRFTSDPAYVAIVGHRNAALADSRLLPLAEGPLTPPSPR
jgi:uncharacterized protein (DUF1330 family)